MKKTVLITGGAGFIGSQLTKLLLANKYKVISIDNFNDYYSPSVKKNNIAPFLTNKNYISYHASIFDQKALDNCFRHKISTVVHLAGRAGVRSSLDNPELYYEANVTGTLRILEAVKKFKVKHLIFGSSSSVYGNTNQIPFIEFQPTSSHISPYASSKKSAEVLCATYANLYDINTTIFRFFTVYGPHGRPDMAPYLFTNAILKNQEIKKFGDGSSKRDYTYIDDITNGILKGIEKPFRFEIFNLGNNNPITLNTFIEKIENVTGEKAIIKQVKIPPGDVSITFASIEKSEKFLNWKPSTSLQNGLRLFTRWLKTQ
jgi:UDP-glucuronate 4-epimerase